MPTFDSDASLSISYSTGNFGDDFSFVNFQLLETVPAAAQVEVRYEAVSYQVPGGAVYSAISGDYALSADQLDEFRNLSRSGAVFASGSLEFDEDSKEVTVPLPVSNTITDGITIGGATYNQLEFVSPVINGTTQLNLRRSTDVTSAIAQFQPGSRLTSDMLNNARNQNLYAIQELTAFGSLSDAEGGGGGGEFAGSIWDIPGATALAPPAADGVVVWNSSAMSATYDALGVVPDSSGCPDNCVLVTKPSSANVSKTEWEDLDTNLITAVEFPGIYPPGSLSAWMFPIDTAFDYITTEANGLRFSQDLRVVGDLRLGNNSWSVNDRLAITLTTGSSIDDLDDVDTTTTPPDAGNVLTWNADDQKWIPGSSSAQNQASAYVTFSPNSLRLAGTGNQSQIVEGDGRINIFKGVGENLQNRLFSYAQDDLFVTKTPGEAIASLASAGYVQAAGNNTNTFNAVDANAQTFFSSSIDATGNSRFHRSGLYRLDLFGLFESVNGTSPLSGFMVLRTDGSAATELMPFSIPPKTQVAPQATSPTGQSITAISQSSIIPIQDDQIAGGADESVFRFTVETDAVAGGVKIQRIQMSLTRIGDAY